MRRRMWFAVTVVMAASLAVGVGFAGAASPKKSTPKKATAKFTTLNCKVSLTTEPPDGSNAVDQPAAQGNQYGPIHCRTSGVGGGIIGDSFTVPDSGDTVGTYTQYFGAGSIRGAFDLTPQEQPSPFETGGYASQTWTGTVTVVGGTGVYRGITGKKNSGVMNCSSPDSVHITCTETVKVKMPSSTKA